MNDRERVANPQIVEYSVILPNSEARERPVAEEPEPLSLRDRRSFMQLPLAQRRRILAQQAEAMVEHYEQETARGANSKGETLLTTNSSIPLRGEI